MRPPRPSLPRERSASGELAEAARLGTRTSRACRTARASEVIVETRALRAHAVGMTAKSRQRDQRHGLERSSARTAARPRSRRCRASRYRVARARARAFVAARSVAAGVGELHGVLTDSRRMRRDRSPCRRCRRRSGGAAAVPRARGRRTRRVTRSGSAFEQRQSTTNRCRGPGRRWSPRRCRRAARRGRARARGRSRDRYGCESRDAFACANSSKTRWSMSVAIPAPVRARERGTTPVFFVRRERHFDVAASVVYSTALVSRLMNTCVNRTRSPST